jgi:hypothetical protein
MAPRDQNDVLHSVDAQAQVFGKCEPDIDVLDYPSSEIT